MGKAKDDSARDCNVYGFVKAADRGLHDRVVATVAVAVEEAWRHGGDRLDIAARLERAIMIILADALTP